MLRLLHYYDLIEGPDMLWLASCETGMMLAYAFFLGVLLCAVP